MTPQSSVEYTATLIEKKRKKGNEREREREREIDKNCYIFAFSLYSEEMYKDHM